MGDNAGHGHALTGVSPGVVTDINYAQPLPYTWLSLDRYASILGIGPANFNGATANPIWPSSGCQDMFYKYPWQNDDRISREEIVKAIQSAEYDISKAIGFPLAPTWITEEVQIYPHHYRPEVYQGLWNVRDQHISVGVDWRKTIGGGRRTVTLVQSGAVPVYFDLDGDGFFETARVTCATTQTIAKEVKVYFHGMGGVQEWEIRPCKSKSIAAGVFTADFWTWQFIDPDVQSWFPGSGTNPTPTDISGNPPANVVPEVDVYREYNDTTQTACQFIWEPRPTTGCCSLSFLSSNESFGLTAQDGFILVRDPEMGQVFPMVASYDATNGWTEDDLATCREPDMVKLWYQAGAIDQGYMRGTGFDPLSNEYALWIAMVATARLERTVCSCSCGNTSTLFARWREDLAEVESGRTRYIDFTGDTLGNPLGTHRGEVEVWKKIKRLLVLGGAAV